MTAAPEEISSDKTAIRPFQVGFPEADLTDLFAGEMRDSFRSLR